MVVPSRSAFPADFVFGASTAAYQNEGAVAEDGRTPSIWDTFVRHPGAVADGTTGETACDSYHRYREDAALMADLGLDAHRFSISWPRVQPGGTGRANEKGLDFYRRAADAMLEHGITPWATLYHWDLPQELEDRGGWLVRDTADRFADYVDLVVGALGDRISHWVTLNEPWCSSFLGYASGVHAPGRREGARAAQAAHHLLLAHGLGLARVRERQPQAQVGTSLNLYSVRAASDSPEDRDAARRIDGLSNRFFLDPLLRGRYPQDVLDDMGQADWFAWNATADDLAAISAPIDFLGVNYYSRHTVAAADAVRDAAARPTTDAAGEVQHAVDGSAYPGSETVVFVGTDAPRTQMNWEIHPDGLIDVLQMAAERAPGLPLYITENGSAYEDVTGPDGTVDDPERIAFLQQHLQACADAVARGLPLKGYFAWTLMDNFEWSWGFSRHFGLVHLDQATQARTPKASARWFAGFLGARR